MKMFGYLPFSRWTVCSLLALTSLACSSSSDSGGTLDSGSVAPRDQNSFGATYKFADSEVAGWKQASGTTAYSVWTAANLTDKIDGAAPDYTSRGMKFAMYQNLVGPDPQLCGLVAMDFGTDDQATSMFNYEKQLTSATTAVPQYDASVASGNPGLTGVTVYAHFKASYFELQLDGYPDQGSATQTASTFLKALEKKAN
jgi:hypothetical protein